MSQNDLKIIMFYIHVVCDVFFLQDLKTNEARLQELNNIADKLTAMGKTEAAEKIREQIAVSPALLY